MLVKSGAFLFIRIVNRYLMNIPRRFLILTLPVILLLLIYFSGPAPDHPLFSSSMPVVPEDPALLENYITAHEGLHKIKPDNEARIIWFDSTKRKTKYAVVYLHGFSASQMEGHPVHRKFAREFGCNLYLARLADHGVDTTEVLLTFTADRFWESAKQALAIGKQIGEKVILISTSTGGTAALMLAAQFPEDVAGLINLSPNIAINDPAAFLLNDPWGLQIARLVMKSKYREWEASDERKKYWNNKYRLEAIVQLEELVERSMTKETFSKVKQPALTLYYFKNENEQDPEVKVSAMLEMNSLLGTPDSLKMTVAIPNAGAHVLGSPMASKDVKGVYREMEKFAMGKLKLQKVN